MFFFTKRPDHDVKAETFIQGQKNRELCVSGAVLLNPLKTELTKQNPKESEEKDRYVSKSLTWFSD